MSFHRRGQASGSVAALVILLTVLGLLLFYIFTVPEAERELLNITGPQHVVLDAKPGTVGEGEIEYKEMYEHGLPTISVDNSPYPETRLLRSQVLVEKGVFSEDALSLSFEITDKSILAWAKIEAFVVEKYGTGDIVLILNGEKVYSAPADANTKASMQLPPDLIVVGKNNLTITASSPGWTFWRANAYKLSNVNLVLGEYDSPTARVTQLVSISENEITGIGRARLVAFVKQLGEPANMKIYVNGEEIFNALPPSSLSLDIPVSLLKVGSNKIDWEVARDGIYQIQFGELVISTTELPAEAKEYDFTISSSLYNKISAGKVDCEVLLRRDATRSAGDDIIIRLNTQIIRRTFTNNEILVEDVCDDLKQGANSISLSAEEDIYIERLRITLKE